MAKMGQFSRSDDYLVEIAFCLDKKAYFRFMTISRDRGGVAMESAVRSTGGFIIWVSPVEAFDH